MLLSCSNKKASVDYFDQKPPDAIPVVFAKGIVSIEGRFEHGISFTPDGQEMAFGVLDKGNFNGTIYYSKKNNNAWSEPVFFEPLINKSTFLPYFSPDGKSLIYTQSRPDTANYLTDIWIVNKEGSSWVAPQKMGSPLSSSSREATACITLDKKVYFSSNRGQNGLADLYFASLENGKYSEIKNLSTLNTTRDEESIFVSPNDNYIIFCHYATNENGPDLYISYRNKEGNWIQPAPLDSSINSNNWERRPFVTIDNKYLFFTRMAFGAEGLAESDIYWASTKKIFKPFVYNPLAKTTVVLGKEIKVPIPADYFKDIDDEELEISFNDAEFDWVKFNKDAMCLTLTPNMEGEFELVFTAIDNNLNKTEDVVKIIVE